MPLLNGVLTLHDLQDAEKLVRYSLDLWLKRHRKPLAPHEYDDAVTDLLAHTWKLSHRYNPQLDTGPTKGRPRSFAAYAAYQLRSYAITDWMRARYGQPRYGGRPIPLSLDKPTHPASHIDEATHQSDAYGGAGGLVETLVSLPTHTPDHLSPDLTRALNRRNSGDPWNTDPGSPPPKENHRQRDPGANSNGRGMRDAA